MLSRKEQYEHPNWRRKSNEILERDDYTCRCCKSKTIQLNAHHLYYEKGLLIWEYENEAIVTLCKKCHSEIHFELAKLAGIIAFEILSGHIDATDFLNRIKTNYNGGR
jgi:5-methylcytosine-specific restriction endonuclease McrA